jgi:ArsR family transcriptional regulator
MEFKALIERHAGVFKALSDPNRLVIAGMVARGELCACVILGRFQITQPTLSHHMKILCGCGLVKGRKEGKWMYYSLDKRNARALLAFLRSITTHAKPSVRAACDCECECQPKGKLLERTKKQ